MEGGSVTEASLIGRICEIFSCTPSQALKEDPRWVMPIIEARLAKEAKAMQNTDVTKMKDYPHMVKFWMEFLKNGKRS